jgi:tagatose 6-phosphate kinase
MIGTVTLNPTVDKHYEVEKLIPGEAIRVRGNRQAAAGKGIQVAKVARLLGEEVIATGFLGGRNGEFIREALEKAGIRTEFVPVASETRTCVNIRDLSTGRITELLEEGASVAESAKADFSRRFGGLLSRCGIIAVCGSVPPGIDAQYVCGLIRTAKAAGKTVLFDASGELLAEGIKACPDLIKPNRTELGELIGRELSDLNDILAAARDLQKTGISNVIVSLGKDGAVFVLPEGTFRGTTPDIPVVNTVGCGDSMVAGFAAGLRQGLPAPEKICLAMAVSTANALHKETGFFVQEDLEKLLSMVKAEQIN